MTYASQQTLAVHVAFECLAWSLFDQRTINNRLEFEYADESGRRNFFIGRH